METKTQYIPYKVKDISLAEWGRLAIGQGNVRALLYKQVPDSRIRPTACLPQQPSG